MKKNRWVIGGQTIFAIVLLVLLLKFFVGTTCTIPSSGMENSLYQGERVFVNKWSYGLRLPFSTLRWGERKVKKGDIVLFNNPNPKKVSTPIYKREIFISRCVGIPGDTLMLNDELLVSNNNVFSPDSKNLYIYPYENEKEMVDAIKKQGINDHSLVGYQNGYYIRSFSRYEFYLLQQALRGKVALSPLYDGEEHGGNPFVIPAKGVEVKVYPWNIKLLCNTISRHEGKQATVRNDILYINGFPVTSYVFTKNYYWMASNTPINLCDSRLFGLVPDTHVIGKASRIWYSSRKRRFFSRVQ